jgi:hypothetical protein
MGSFEDWLAAMPVKDVRRRIAELEQELGLMRILLAQHDQGSRPSEPSSSPVVREPVSSPSGVAPRRGRGSRVSPEREAILNVLREHPDGMSPVGVARQIGKEPNPVQTNMSRMTKAGMIVRVGTGQYRLPSTEPTVGTSASLNGTLLLDEPSGSEGEAMEP